MIIWKLGRSREFSKTPHNVGSKKNPGRVGPLRTSAGGYFIPNRSIYRLKQASKSWNIHFDEIVKSFGFIKNMYELCVYKKTSESAIVILILYVDNILLIKNDIPMLQLVKIWLS